MKHKKAPILLRICDDHAAAYELSWAKSSVTGKLLHDAPLNSEGDAVKQAAAALRLAVQTAELKPSQVLLCIENQWAFSQEVIVPDVCDRELATSLKLSPAKYIPSLSYPACMWVEPIQRAVNADVSDTAVGQRVSLVSGISSAVLASFNQVADELRLKRLTPFVGLRAPAYTFQDRYKEIFANELIGFLHLEKHHWLLEVYDKGKLSHHRHVPWSFLSDDDTASVQGECGRAEELKQQLRSSLPLIHSEKKMSRLFVSGSLPGVREIAKELMFALELPVVAWAPHSGGLSSDSLPVPVLECVARSSNSAWQKTVTSIDTTAAAGQNNFRARVKAVAALSALLLAQGAFRAYHAHHTNTVTQLQTRATEQMKLQEVSRNVARRVAALDYFDGTRMPWGSTMSQLQYFPNDSVSVKRLRISVEPTQKQLEKNGPVFALVVDGTTQNNESLEVPVSFLQTFANGTVELQRLDSAEASPNSSTVFSVRCLLNYRGS